MDEDARVRIISVLLKSLYQQNLISEDVYNHSPDNPSKMLDYGEELEYGAVRRELGKMDVYKIRDLMRS